MRYAALFLCLMVFSPSFAAAGKIAINPVISSPGRLPAGEAWLQVSVTNQGEEDATDVTVRLQNTPWKSGELSLGRISPGGQKAGNISITLPDGLMPGTYEVGVITRYRDTNGHPFTSAKALTIDHDISTSSKVIGLIAEVDMGGNPSPTELRLYNRDLVGHNVSVELLLPDEVKGETASFTVLLEPSGEGTVHFTIGAPSATAGSAYNIFAVLSYSEGGRHFSSVAGGMARKVGVSSENPVRFPEWAPKTGFVLTLCLIIYGKFRSHGRAR
jgi:uncharacterized membrane protein